MKKQKEAKATMIIRIPASTKKKLAGQAKKLDVSMNRLISFVLTNHLREVMHG